MTANREEHSGEGAASALENLLKQENRRRLGTVLRGDKREDEP